MAEEEGEDPDPSLAAGGDGATAVTEMTEASLLSTASEKSMEWLEVCIYASQPYQSPPMAWA